MSRLMSVAALLAGAGLAIAQPPAGQPPAAQMEHTAPTEKAGSVVGLDVAAHEGIIDLVSAVQEADGVRLYHSRSRDGGATFGARTAVSMFGEQVSNAMRGLDPQIAAIGDKVFVVWTTPGEGNHGVGPLATSISEDGGRTWKKGTQPADDGTKRGHAFIEALADAAGTLHVVWLETRETRGLQIATSRDFGATWGKTLAIDAVTCECCWNKLISVKPGSAHVLYRDKDPRDMAIARSDDFGATWQRLATVGEFKWGIQACPFTGGGLALTGTAPQMLHATVFSLASGHRGVSYLASKDLGRTWSEAMPLGEGAGQHSDLASVGETLIAVFDVLDPQDGRIVVARISKDAGKTWAAAKRLSGAGVSADFPRVVSAAGRFTAVWTERDANGLISWRSAGVE